MTKTWTKSEINYAIQLSCNGLTARQIAYQFKDVTRNQIIGIFFRNKNNPLWASKQKIKPVKKEKIKPAIKQDAPKQIFQHGFNIKPKKYTLEFKKYEKVFTGIPIKFLDAGLNQCKWIVNTSKNPHEVTCCGQPSYEYGKAWCKEHRHIVYRKVVIDDINGNSNTNKSLDIGRKK